MITLGQLKTEFTSILTSRKVNARLANWVHWVHTDIINSYDFWWNKKQGSLTTVASTAEYCLSTRVNGKQVSWMGNSASRNKEITEVPLEEIYRLDSTPTETGDPIYWAYVGESEVQAVTTVAATVNVVSTSASDSSINVFVQGLVSSAERYEEIALTGTSTATGTLTFDIDGVASVSLASVCVGSVTVKHGTVTIAVIPPGQLRVTCPRIRLWRVPGSTVLTLPYIYYKNALKPVKDSEIIDLPDSAMKCLRRGISVIGHEDNGDQDFMQLNDSLYEKEKRDLYSMSTRQLNVVHKKNFHRRPSGDVPSILPRLIIP